MIEATQDLLEPTRAALAPLLGVALAGLRRHRAEQAAYAPHARDIARTVAEMLNSAGEEAGPAGRAVDDGDEDAWAAFGLLLDPGDQIDDNIASAVSGRSVALDGAQGQYCVFTTAYDREVAAGTLVRPEQLKELRARLDERIAGVGLILAHLARDLKALLAVPARDGWDRGQEDGLIDGRRLAQLISSPTERRLFRAERQEPAANCLVIT